MRKGVSLMGRSAGVLPVVFLLALAQAGCSLPRGTGPERSADGPARGKSSRIQVRVTFRELPAAGALVEWRDLPDAAGKDSEKRGSTDGRGMASFDLPPGRYFLVAHLRGDGDYARPIAPGDRFAYFGGNPVYAAPGPPREMYVTLEEYANVSDPLPVPPGGTGIAGRVTAGGAPVADARVSAYHRADTAFRDPGFAASAPTGGDGGFVLDLLPGKYFLVARKRAAGGAAGPLRKGDLFGYFPANPVIVETGRYAQAAIPATILRQRNAPAWSGGYEASSRIEGRILDAAGRPRQGAYAALYDNPDLLNRPLFISDVTGPDGRYRLPVPVAGRYHLGARSGYGGAPAAGDLYGRYEGNPDHSVAVGEGDRLVGFDIVVDEVR